MNLEIRVGNAGNGTPVFMAAAVHPAMARPFGAVYDAGRRIWMYPAFYPAAKKVLHDFDILSKDIPLVLSDVARRHVKDLEQVEESVANRELPRGFEFVTKPYDHQILGLVHLWWLLRSALFYAPGLGKSKIAVDLVRLMRHTGKKGTVLVFGPLVTVKSWGREIDRHSDKALRWIALHGTPEERQEMITALPETKPDIILMTYDGVRTMGKQIVEQIDYDTVICDECFPAGTTINTAEGPRFIEHLTAGVRVLSRDSEGLLAWKQVTKVYRRPRKAPLVRVTHTTGSFICTSNHRIWTEENGYTLAKDLSACHTLTTCNADIDPKNVQSVFTGFSFSDERNILQRSTGLLFEHLRRAIPVADPTRTPHQEEVCVVPSVLFVPFEREKSSQRASVLQQVVLGEMANVATRDALDGPNYWHSCGYAESPQRNLWNPRDEKSVIPPDEEKQPDLHAGCSSQNQSETQGTDVPFAGRERAAHCSSNPLGRSHRVADRSIHSYTCSTGSVQEFADGLQSGLGLRQTENCSRGRRSFAQDTEVEVSRQTENRGTQRSRVVGVSYVESRSDAGLVIGSEQLESVYDLEVEDHHNYFAEGVLVSNSHLVKSWDSDRTISTYEVVQKAQRRVLMTGSPTQGDPRDVYGQYKILGDCFMPEEWKLFKQRFLKKPSPISHTVTGFKNLDVLNGRVNFLSLHRTKKECLDLPSQTIIDVEYDLSRAQKVVHNQIVEEMAIDPALLAVFLWGNQMLLPPASRMPHRAAALLKLLQIASGFLITNPIDDAFCDAVQQGGCVHLQRCIENRIRPHTPRCQIDSTRLDDIITDFEENPKLDTAIGILDSVLADPANKCIIWCVFEHELDILSARLTKQGWDHVRVDGSNSKNAQDIIDQFTADGNLRVYLAQATTGVGVTINAATYMIFYSIPYSLTVYMQDIDRNYRIGQTEPVTVYRLLGRGTPEPAIAKLLDVKVDVDEVLTHRMDCLTCDRNLTCIGEGTKPFDPNCIHKRSIDRPVTQARAFHDIEAPEGVEDAEGDET